MHDYVVYCYLLPAGSGSMYAMGISVPQFIGAIILNNYQNAADLQQALGRLGLTPAQQTQIVNALTKNGSMFVMSGVSVTNAVAESFGIELHDGEMPDEPNQIQFVQISNAGAVPLVVNVVLNSQIMPAPVWGAFEWGDVEDCLLSSGIFTQAQVDSMRNQIETTGSNTSNWTGISTAIVNCLGTS
jgi:hypothetical protein